MTAFLQSIIKQHGQSILQDRGLFTEVRAECKGLVVVALGQRTTRHSSKFMLIACYTQRQQ